MSKLAAALGSKHSNKQKMNGFGALTIFAIMKLVPPQKKKGKQEGENKVNTQQRNRQKGKT
jgi:hypothetical protein